MTHSESIRRGGITFEEVRCNYFEAVTRKIVDKELIGLSARSMVCLVGEERITCKVIRELEAKDVRQVDDGLVFRVIDFGSSDICLDAIDLFVRPLSCRGIGVLKSKTNKDGYDVTLPSAVPS